MVSEASQTHRRLGYTSYRYSVFVVTSSDNLIEMESKLLAIADEPDDFVAAVNKKMIEMDAANPDESLRTPELLLVEMFPPARSKIVVTEEEMVELEIIPPPQPDELPGWVWAVMFTAIFLIFTAVGSYFFGQWWSNKKSNPSQS